VSVKRPPAVPAPAATLVLLRDRPGGGVETLLIQRHQASRFAAGDFVFPGGKLGAEDASTEAVQWCRGLDAATAARRLDLPDPPTALGYWIGAIREAFEEVGILLADGPSGQPMTVDASRLDAYRQACQHDPLMFWQMVRAEGLRLATDRLIYFAHWVTPEEHPLRFDTRFFAAPMPAGQTAVADEREIVAVRWIAPGEALAAMRRGEISLRLPTVKNLALFEGASGVAQALGGLAGREVAAIRPRLIREAGGLRAVLPDEPGWY
jgi:8-oxo-dGTP pyrophosphatase MutT (NUDIX family)